jgi:hypothetical protein
MSLVERLLAFIARAEKCQALAEAASTDVNRAHYLQLAQVWLEFARARRQMLIIEGKYKPVDGADDGAAGSGITVLKSER